MRLKFSLFVAAFVITACTTPYIMQSRFDMAQAQKALENGNNTISGEAFMRKNGGDVVTCAGYDVKLIPDTPYARERMNVEYGNFFKGYKSYYRNITFSPDDPQYYMAMRQETCSSTGHFKFNNVKSGEYFIVAKVVWYVSETIQGGSLMQRVIVEGGENKEVILVD